MVPPILLPNNGGPAAARNAGFAEAAGRWVAVLDSDDLMHPRRLERLVAEAEREGADIIADDLLVFHETGGRAPHRHLRGRLARSPAGSTAASTSNPTRSTPIGSASAI